MSRTNRALMIPDSNQECFMKMSVCRLQEEVFGGEFGRRQSPNGGLRRLKDLKRDAVKYFKLFCEVQGRL